MNKFLLFLGAAITLIFGERTRNQAFIAAGIVWSGTNSFLQWYATLPFLVWVVLCLTASIGRWSDGWFVAILAIPVLVLVLASSLWPSAVGVLVATYDRSEEARKWVGTLCAGLAWIMFVVVMLRIIPIYNDPTYAALAGLLAVILGLWSMRNGAPFWSVIIERWGSRALGLIILIIIAMLFMGGRDKATEQVKSVVYTVADLIPSPNPNSTGHNGTANSANTSADYPICSGSEDVELNLQDKRKVELSLRNDCWTGWITIPYNTQFAANNGPGNRLHAKFWTGQTADTQANNTRVWTGIGAIQQKNFRLRGEGDKVTVSLDPL